MKKNCTISISPELKSEAMELAKRSELSLSALISNTLRKLIKAEKDGK